MAVRHNVVVGEGNGIGGDEAHARIVRAAEPGALVADVFHAAGAGIATPDHRRRVVARGCAVSDDDAEAVVALRKKRVEAAREAIRPVSRGDHHVHVGKVLRQSPGSGGAGARELRIDVRLQLFAGEDHAPHRELGNADRIDAVADKAHDRAIAPMLKRTIDGHVGERSVDVRLDDLDGFEAVGHGCHPICRPRGTWPGYIRMPSGPVPQ